jgi:hypothetical protein
MAQLFYEQFDSTIKRGDIFSKYPPHTRYRNDNLLIYTGSCFVNLIDTIDEYGHIPPQFTTEEFSPSHWTNTIDHNNIIWFTPNKYTYTKPQQITHDIFCISNPQNKYPIYFVYTEEHKIPIYQYAIDILPKITIPVSCDNGNTLIQEFGLHIDNTDAIVIIDNSFITNNDQEFSITSTEQLIKYSLYYNWRDLITKYIYAYNKPKHNFFDLYIQPSQTKNTIKNINIKFFDKNIFV